MKKKYTDADKWRNRFFRDLPTPYKLFWLYLCDECDTAGIWPVDFEMAKLQLGETVEAAKALLLFGERVRIIDGGNKWFLPDHVIFQQGSLSRNKPAHIGAIRMLEKYNLINNDLSIKPYEKQKVTNALASPCQPIANPLAYSNSNSNSNSLIILDTKKLIQSETDKNNPVTPAATTTPDNTDTPNKPRTPKKPKPDIIYPTIDEVIAYCTGKGFSRDFGAHVFTYYSESNWTKSNNGIVINWKQTILNNWMTADNQRKDQSGGFKRMETTKQAAGNSFAEVVQHTLNNRQTLQC